MELQDSAISLSSEAKEKEGDDDKAKQAGDAIGLTLDVGEINSYEPFGHIDFLFRHNNPTVVKELEEALNIFSEKNRYSSLNNNSGNNLNTQMQTQVVSAIGSSSGIVKKRSDKTRTSTMGLSVHSGSTAQGGPAVKVFGGGERRRQDSMHETEPAVKLTRGEIARALEPGMFMSYHMRSMCEFLLIGVIEKIASFKFLIIIRILCEMCNL